MKDRFGHGGQPWAERRRWSKSVGRGSLRESATCPQRQFAQPLPPSNGAISAHLVVGKKLPPAARPIAVWPQPPPCYLSAPRSYLALRKPKSDQIQPNCRARTLHMTPIRFE